MATFELLTRLLKNYEALCCSWAQVVCFYISNTNLVSTDIFTYMSLSFNLYLVSEVLGAEL
jgi:hypothetical protein